MEKQSGFILSRLSWRGALEITALTILFLLLLIVVSIIDGNAIWGSPTFDFQLLHVVIATIPFIILLVVLGYMKEIQGPMGISLTIQNEASNPIEPILGGSNIDFIGGPKLTKGAIETSVPAESNSVVTESGSVSSSHVEESEFDINENQFQDVFPIDWNELNQDERERLGRSAAVYQAIENRGAVVLSFEIGNPTYDINAIADYMRVIRRHPFVEHVLFIDSNQKFAGLMDVSDFHDYCSSLWIEPTDDIESGAILTDPRVLTDAVNQNTTNSRALNRMEEADYYQLAVIDDDDRFQGVISQERITRNVLSSVFQNSS
jgi:hypothetical protein